MSIQRYETSSRASQAVCYQQTVYLSGLVAKDLTGDINVQTQSVLDQLDSWLSSVGSDRRHLLSITFYIKEINFLSQMNALWEAWIPAGFAPAYTCVEAGLTSPDILLEASVIAARRS